MPHSVPAVFPRFIFENPRFRKVIPSGRELIIRAAAEGSGMDAAVRSSKGWSRGKQGLIKEERMANKNVLRGLGAFLYMSSALAVAQAYPSKTITLIAVLAPGTGMDIIARMYSARLAQNLGRPVVVENKPGGSQIPGMTALLNAPADGHTLLVASSTSMPAPSKPSRTLQPLASGKPGGFLGTSRPALSNRPRHSQWAA